MPISSNAEANRMSAELPLVFRFKRYCCVRPGWEVGRGVHPNVLHSSCVGLALPPGREGVGAPSTDDVYDTPLSCGIRGVRALTTSGLSVALPQTNDAVALRS